MVTLEEEESKNYIPTQMDKLIIKLEALEIGKFYGSFKIKFESGYITHCKKTESIKL